MTRLEIIVSFIMSLKQNMEENKMKLTKKISAVVLAALMAVVAIFAGCSSTKSNDDSKTNNESTTSAAKVRLLTLSFQAKSMLLV